MAIKPAKERFVDLLGDVDYHGPRRVMRSGGCCRGVYWLLVLILIWALGLYSLHAAIARYMSFPTTSDTFVEHRRDVVYPAVTVCNKNYVVKLRAEHLPNQLTDVLAGADRANLRPENVNRSHVGNLVKTASYHQDWVIPRDSCRRLPGDTDVVNCTEFNIKWRQIFPYGSCYTVNSEGQLETDRAGQSAALQFDVNTDPNNDPTGVTAMLNGAAVRVRPQDTNTDDTLTINKAALPDLYSTADRGVVLLLHDSDSEPDFTEPEADIIELSAADKGSEYRLGVTAREVRSLSEPFGEDCVGGHRRRGRGRGGRRRHDDDDDDDDDDDEESCDKTCLAKAVLAKLNCTMYDLPQQSATEGLCSEDKLAEYYGALVDARRDCCRPSCVKTLYSVKITPELSASRDPRYVTVKTYFRTSEVEVTEERPVFPLHMLLSEMALIVLIFVGFMPCICCAHFLEFIVDMICSCCCSKTGSHAFSGEVEGGGEGGEQGPSSDTAQHDD